MGQRIFSLVLFTALGVVLGVGLSDRQNGNPLLREVANQQKELMKIVSPGEDNNLLARIKALEQKIAVLESGAQFAQGMGAGNMPQGAQQPMPPQPPQEDFAQIYNIPIDHSPIIGNKNAPVTLVEFVDFQCPFCSRFHQPIAELRKEYGDKVNYIVKHYPLSFHPLARPASKAAFAAGEQGKYAEMVDAILSDNSKLISEDSLKEFAKAIGLNVDKWQKDLKEKDAQWEKYIEADMALAATIDVRGTPTMFLGGRKTNARDLAGYKREVDQILSEKK
jgi:protein-disulfide isomerase